LGYGTGRVRAALGVVQPRTAEREGSIREIEQLQLASASRESYVVGDSVSAWGTYVTLNVDPEDVARRRRIPTVSRVG
jgi:hypothetical protein